MTEVESTLSTLRAEVTNLSAQVRVVAEHLGVVVPVSPTESESESETSDATDA